MDDKKTITITIEEYNLLLENQKQVDELTKRNFELAEKGEKVCIAYKQAVKDTAKEICDLILEHWEKKQFVECDWLRVAISERYGVEVE